MTVSKLIYGLVLLSCCAMAWALSYIVVNAFDMMLELQLSLTKKCIMGGVIPLVLFFIIQELFTDEKDC